MTSQDAARREDLCLPGRRTSRVSFRMARGDRRGGRTDRAAPAVDRLARDLRSPLAPARDHRAGDRPAGGPRDAARRAAAGRDAAAAAADDRAGCRHSSQRSCRGRRTPCANPTRCRCAQSHPAAPMSLMPCGSLPSRETAEYAWVDPLDDGLPGRDPRVDLVHIEFFQAIDAICLHPDHCVFYAPAQLLERPPRPRGRMDLLRHRR